MMTGAVIGTGVPPLPSRIVSSAEPVKIVRAGFGPYDGMLSTLIMRAPVTVVVSRAKVPMLLRPTVNPGVTSCVLVRVYVPGSAWATVTEVLPLQPPWTLIVAAVVVPTITRLMRMVVVVGLDRMSRISLGVLSVVMVVTLSAVTRS